MLTFLWILFIRGSFNKFPDFFRMGTFIDSIHMKLVPFEVISSGCNALVVPFQQLLEGSMEVCDKDGVVDWCIVLLEMPLTRFEECWPLPKESLPELP